MALYTMGYEGLDGRRFLANLLHHGVDVVADIRKLPISRKKGFSKTALKEMLNNKNIKYLNFQGLDAPKEIRDELYQSGNYNRFFNKYLKSNADKHDLLEAIQKLINSGKNVSLLCFESSLV